MTKRTLAGPAEIALAVAWESGTFKYESAREVDASFLATLEMKSDTVEVLHETHKGSMSI